MSRRSVIDRSKVLNLELVDRMRAGCGRTPSRCNASRPGLRVRHVPAVA
jgi:hypothetical protein